MGNTTQDVAEEKQHKIIYATFTEEIHQMIDEYGKQRGIKKLKNTVEYLTMKGLKDAGYEVDVI